MPPKIKQKILHLVFLLKRASRPTIANLLMLSFILFSTIGAFLIYIPAGFITAGICCGLLGLLLGLE